MTENKGREFTAETAPTTELLKALGSAALDGLVTVERDSRSSAIEASTEV